MIKGACLVVFGLVAVVGLTGCSKLSAKGKRDCASDAWKNEDPPFCLSIPAGYVAKGAPTNTPEGNGKSVEFRNDAVSNQVYLRWFTGSLPVAEEQFRAINPDAQISREDFGDGVVFLKAKSKSGTIGIKAYGKSSKPPVNPADPSYVQLVECEGGWGSDEKYANPEIEKACRSLVVK